MSANKKGQFKSFAILLCAGGLTVAVAGLVYFYGAPKIYRATAKAKIVMSGWNATNQVNASFGPERLPEECKLIQSDKLLDQVISNLDLNTSWGKQFNQGAPLKTEQSRERLKAMLDVHPAPKAILIEIQATGSDPVELAKVVNEVTRLYADFRQAGREQASQLEVDALRAKWQAQCQKVQDAQAELDKMADEFNRERTNSQVFVVYDPGTLEALKAKRAALEDEYSTKSNELAQLKALDPRELRKVVAAMETNTNSVLSGALRQWTNANNELREVQAAHEADAPETKSAALMLAQIDHHVDGLVNATIRLRELELDSLKSALLQVQAMTDQINRSTNHSTNELARFKEQEATFDKAKEHLQALTRERDALERQMMSSDSMSAVMPGAIVARIVELADPPENPVSPDRQVVRGTLIAGGAGVAAGLLLLVLLAMKPRGAEKREG
jgi:capsular polysaccharide biosynthesis protein